MRKKIMWFAILLLAICNKIAAEDRVYVSDFSISPGETREINVMLDNEDAYVGFQFDVYLPDGFTITSCSKSDRIPDGTTVLGNQRTDDTGNFYRVIGASLTGNAITGTSGAIATLTITADASVALNDYTGYLRNIKVSKASGTGLTKDQETFTIMVKSPEPYAALSSDNKTLTFYYDSQKQTRSGMSIGPFASGSNISWYSQRTSITTVVFDASFANYTNLTSTAYWFIGCHNLTTITGIANLKTDNVTSMVSMFSNCVNLHWVDVSGFNTSNVTDMSNMFMNCSKLEYVDVTHFNTAKVNNMSGMFYGCTDLSGLDVSGFDTGNVTTMKEMFRDCSSLSTLDISNFNTAKVTTMLGMFFGCSHLGALEFGNNFVTSKVQSMSMMFAGCKYLEALDLSNFDTSNVLGMYNMFESCQWLETIDLSSFNTANVLDMTAMFLDCANLKSINLSSFNTAKVTNMAAMFYECPDLIKLDLKNFNTAKVKEMARMFYNCTSLTTIDVGSEWSTASVTDSGENMFSGCTNLKGGSGTTYDESHIDKEYARIDEGTANPGYLTGPIPEPYAVLSDDNTTLTFYYDTKKADRGGISIGPFNNSALRGWNDAASTITSVVFDGSFANYTSLTSTANWFYGCSNLTTITGIANLNTDNVTNMSFMFDGCSGLTSLDVSNFKTDNVTNMSYMFDGCSGLTSLDVSSFKTSNVTDMGEMFKGCSGLTSLDVSGFNTEKVTKMGYMFEGCSSLLSLDVSHFNTGHVTNMYFMFQHCSSLSSIDLSSFNTEKVTTMQGMFSYCSGLTSLDLGNFKTDQVQYMMEMFRGCNSLTSLNVSNFNTANLSEMQQMFEDCSSLKTLDLSSFNTTKVSQMHVMFSGCSNLTTITVGDGWNTANVTYSWDMFKDCAALVGGAGTTYDADHIDKVYAHIDGGTDNPGYFTKVAEPEPYAVLTDNDDDVTVDGVSGKGKTLTFYYDTQKESRGGMSVGPFTRNYSRDWDSYASSITSVVFDGSFTNCTSLTSTAYWFYGCKNLTSITGIENLKTKDVTNMGSMFNSCSVLTSLDVSGFNTDNVTNMDYMFKDCSSLTSLDASGFNTVKVTYLSNMFYGCSSLTSLDVSGFNTENVTSMLCLFYGCSSLASLDVSGFSTEKVTNMQSMFDGCSSLTSLDVSGFKTSNVTKMDYMFKGCSSLTSLDVSGFNTGKVTSMQSMFDGCSRLTSLDVSGFNTENVTTMNDMFDVCSGLTSLDVSGFNTEKVTDMSSMFNGCSGLKSLDLSNFNTDNVTSMYYMFRGCSGLTFLDVSGFNTEKVKSMSLLFSGCSGLTSLDVSGFNTEKVTEMDYMFYGCSGLTSLDVSGFNTGNVTDMSRMFSGCSALTSLDLSNFNTDNVTDMYDMFLNCSGMTTILVGSGWNTGVVTKSTDMFKGCAKLVGGAGTKYDANHIDKAYAHIDGGTSDPGYLSKKAPDPYAVLSSDGKTLTFYYDKNKGTTGMDIGPFDSGSERGWDQQKDYITKVVFDSSFAQYHELTSTYSWFDQCSNLTTIEGLNNLNTENVEDMGCMFEECRSLKSIDLSNFNTTKVDYFGLMFADCSSLTSLDLSGFVTNKATNMFAMFGNCSSLTTIYVGSGWNTDAVTDGREMFNGCDVLVGGAGTEYDADHIDIDYAQIDGGTSDPGYLTDKYGVVITVKECTREYGATNPKFEYTTKGAAISGKPTISCGATATSPVGTYPITVSYTKAEGESMLNITCVNGSMTITKAPLTITAKSYTIKRGEALPTLEATYSGLKNNETDTVFTKKPVISTVAKPDTLPGTYPIVASGAEAKNYEMSYVDGTLTITDDVTVTANSYTRVYGDDNPTFEFTSEGATLSGTPTITCSATATSPVGIYDIVIAKGDITNSTVTCINGTLTITKAPLTITAKSYTIKQGKALPTLEAEYSGFKNNETDTVFTKKPIVSTNATSDSEPGAYDITVSGAEATSYEMTYVNGILTITKKTESFDGIVLVVEENGNIDDAFESCGGKAEVAKTIAAVVWNDTTELKAEMLDGISNPNLLIYVGDEKLAPSGFNNVVINGVAKNIKLTDGGTGNYNFYVPQEFKADSISYSREFKQATRDSVSRGWEGIALPFTVQTFTHEEHGNISPFGNDACDYHFWLRQPTENGVVSAKTIEANKPYIISMPNSDEYEPEFNHAGWITFASASVTVPVTDMEQVLLGDSAWIIPTFLEVEQSPDLYVLNVGDSIQYHPEGSIFISNYRSARPFEVYAQHEGNHNRSGVRVMSLSSLFRGGKGTTDMGIVTIEPTSDAWFDLNGRRLQSKPSKSGLYIHNGKKVLIKDRY